MTIVMERYRELLVHKIKQELCLCSNYTGNTLQMLLKRKKKYPTVTF